MAMTTQGVAVVAAPPGGPRGAPARRRRDAGGGGPPLPDEVLAAPVEAGHLFVERMDDWRKALGWGHERFARYLGISKQYWWLLRTRRRGLTIGVAQRVLRERPELEHFLAAAIRERDWKRRQQG
jgi:hypothetical protein